MKKYGKPTRPKVDLEKFLRTLPCVKCGAAGPSKIYFFKDTQTKLPVCDQHWHLLDYCITENDRPKLYKLAHDLDLMAGDHVACQTIIIQNRRKIFG